jgi:hypothetical protein
MMMVAFKGVQAFTETLNSSCLFMQSLLLPLRQQSAVSMKENRVARDFFGTAKLLYAFVERSALSAVLRHM